MLRVPPALPYPPTDADQCRLFCFHHAGGAASAFRDWKDYLLPAISVAAVQLPGRESRFTEPALTVFEDAVDHLTDVVAPWTDRPYALVGHSLGAALAFEVARRLEIGVARKPIGVIVSGRGPSHLPDVAAGTADEAAIIRSTLPDDQLIEMLRRSGGTPAEFFKNLQLLSLYLPLIRSDLRLAESYRFRKGRLLNCPLLAIGGQDDRIAPAERLARWGDLTVGGANVRLFAGGHFFLHRAVQEVCAAIAEFLSGLGAASVEQSSHAGSRRLIDLD